jgi:hypothetical protein
VENICLTGIYNLREKIRKTKSLKRLNPDLIFALYTGIALLSRVVLNLFLLKNLEEKLIIEIGFLVSLTIIIIFALISLISKIDWYGKINESLISKVIKFFIKKNKNIFWLFLLFFVLDTYLFFVLLTGNGSNKKISYFLGIILSFLSLFLISWYWEKFGILFRVVFF